MSARSVNRSTFQEHAYFPLSRPIMYLIFHDAVKRPTQFLSHTWNCESRDHSFNQKVPSGCHVM